MCHANVCDSPSSPRTSRRCVRPWWGRCSCLRLWVRGSGEWEWRERGRERTHRDRRISYTYMYTHKHTHVPEGEEQVCRVECALKTQQFLARLIFGYCLRLHRQSVLSVSVLVFVFVLWLVVWLVVVVMSRVGIVRGVFCVSAFSGASAVFPAALHVALSFSRRRRSTQSS